MRNRNAPRAAALPAENEIIVEVTGISVTRNYSTPKSQGWYCMYCLVSTLNAARCFDDRYRVRSS